MISRSVVLKWFMAVRPQSLLLSTAAVGMGTGMAFADGVGRGQWALMALLGGWGLHIVVNLVNDYGDFKRGVDQQGEYDPMRRNLVGDLSEQEIKKAIYITLALTLLPCSLLIYRAGWVIFFISVFSLLSAICYTVGKKPLGYLGLGDVLVLVFFGPVAVGGTYYVQSLEINPAVILAGLIPGFLAVGVLTVNNLRDFTKDAIAHKKTLVVRFGEYFGKCEYLTVVFLACLMPVWIYIVTGDRWRILFSPFLLFLFIPIILKIFHADSRSCYDQAIGRTVMVAAIFSLVFTLGWYF